MFPILLIGLLSIGFFSLVREQTEWINQKQAPRWLKKYRWVRPVAKRKQWNGWSKGSSWNLFGWWLLLGRRGIFLQCSRCDWCRIRLCQWKGRNDQVWIGPSNRPCWNSSHHLQCQEGIFWKNCSALFPDYRPNVEESTRKWSRNTIPNRCLLCFQEDLPTINQVFEEEKKNTTNR